MTDPVAPTGVDHVAINVPDVPGGIAFYTETIGLVQNHTRPDFGFPGAWLDTANGQQVHLIEAAGARTTWASTSPSPSTTWARPSPSCGHRGLKVSDPVGGRVRPDASRRSRSTRGATGSSCTSASSRRRRAAASCRNHRPC